MYSFCFFFAIGNTLNIPPVPTTLPQERERKYRVMLTLPINMPAFFPLFWVLSTVIQLLLDNKGRNY